MTPDDFEAWKEHPVTKWVFGMLEFAIEDNKRAIQQYAWSMASGGGADKIDAHQLTVWAERAKAYLSLVHATHEQIASFHDDGEEN